MFNLGWFVRKSAPTHSAPFVPAFSELQRPLFPVKAASFRQRCAPTAVQQSVPECDLLRRHAAQTRRAEEKTGTKRKTCEYAPVTADSSDRTERGNVKVGQIWSLESEKDRLIKVDKYAPEANA